MVTLVSFEESEKHAKKLSYDPGKYQREAVRNIDNEINRILRENNGKPIRILLASKKRGEMIFDDVVGAREVKVKPDPKADFVLINRQREPIAFLSHKKGGDAKDFQQYGGVSTTAGSKIYHHREVQNFLGELTDYVLGGDPHNSYYRKVNSDKLKLMSVFGKDFRKDHFGINSVHAVGQGLPSIRHYRDNIYQLKFGNHIWLAGETYGLVDKYEPALIAVRNNDVNRGYTYKGITVNKIRVTVGPIQIPLGRKALEI